jgi:hypothetical protein
METVNVHSHGKIRVAGVAFGLMLALLLGTLALAIFQGQNTRESLLTQNQSQPLNGVSAARVVIDPGDGNLAIDPFTSDRAVLANASLQYLENQGQPIWLLDTSGGKTVLSVKANTGYAQPWIRLSWEACNGATDWQIHLNPAAVNDIQAHTAGGNVSIDLTGMAVHSVSAETGGGNVNIVFSSKLTGSSTIAASSGAGNVEVHLPAGAAVRVHATTGVGKVMLDSRFVKMDDSTYQTSDFDTAADRFEITLKSGAGNVSVITQ